jgi:hypothetical protein
VQIDHDLVAASFASAGASFDGIIRGRFNRFVTAGQPAQCPVSQYPDFRGGRPRTSGAPRSSVHPEALEIKILLTGNILPHILHREEAKRNQLDCQSTEKTTFTVRPD